MDNYIKMKLNQIYQDKVVRNFSYDSQLYYLIKKNADKKNLTTIDYIEYLGFKYERKKDSGALDERIRELKVSLHKLFPSNIVTGISTKNKDLYTRLREVSYELEKSPIELITDWGFIWKQNNEYDFDQTAAKKLINDFNVKQSHLARWIGVSRQVLNNRLASKHGSSGL